jgi:hypothetical protein
MSPPTIPVRFRDREVEPQVTGALPFSLDDRRDVSQLDAVAEKPQAEAVLDLLDGVRALEQPR